MMKFLTLLLLFMSSIAFGQFSNQQKQYLVMDNLLSNPGLENGKSGWTCAAGTFTASSISGERIDGGLTGKVVLSAQTLNCEIKVATNAALANAGAVILQSIKTSVAGVKVCPIIDNVEDVGSCQTYDGSNIVKELPILPFFGTTNIGIKIKTDSAVTGTVFFDGSKVGRISSAVMPGIAQTKLHYITFSGSSTQTTNGLLNGHTVGTIYGDALLAPTVSTNPSLRIKAGTYGPMTCYFSGRCRAGNGSGSTCTIEYTGTSPTMYNTFGTAGSSGTTNADFSKTVFAPGTYPEREFQVNFSNVTPAASPSHNISQVTCVEAPPESAILSNYVPWKVDVNIGGSSVGIGVVTQSSYTEMTNSGLDMVLNPGSAAVRIPCSTTNAATGLTCSVGNESLGVNIPSLPFPGEYRVCADYSYQASTGAGGVVETTFQLIQTGNASQTIVQEGKSRIQARVSGATTNTYPYRLCGNFIFSDTSEKTIRLMFEQSFSGSVSGVNIMGDRSGADGQRDIHITVEPVTPFMIASLSEKTVEKNILEPVKYKAYVGGASVNTACTGTCTVYGDDGSLVLSLVRTVAGRYTFTSNNAKFLPSSFVSCEAYTATQSGFRASLQMNSVLADANGAVASGGGELRVYNASNVLADGDFWIECKGRLK